MSSEKKKFNLPESLPPEAHGVANSAWERLPPDLRRELNATASSFQILLGTKSANFKDLIAMAKRVGETVVASDTKISILGPVNAGKSTLFNSLTQNPLARSETSPVAGTTKENIQQITDLFQLTDTPGIGLDGKERKEHEKIALSAAKSSDLVLFVVDASVGIDKEDLHWFRQFIQADTPYLVVLNKIDKIPSERRDLLKRTLCHTMGVELENCILISALEGTYQETLILEIAAVQPKVLVQLAQLLPKYRKKLAWQSIRRTAIASALIAVTPIPVVDIIPITALQVGMILTLAKIYEKKMGLARTGEMLATFGSGWLARLAFHELSKIAGGPPGWILAAIVASSTTLTIGFSVMQWFETGKKPSKSSIKKRQSKLFDRLKGYLPFYKKKNKELLREDLEKALDDLADDELSQEV